MPILQPIIDLAAVCYAQGIRHVVISPGSRSAALTLAFVRHGGFQTHVYIDERSAAFVGLGIAQELRQPVVLICTSGSAAYNFAPAIAEAFFQQIPLMILTADRPPEWLHQYDGQTMYQSELYGKHVKKSYEFPADHTHPDAIWAMNRIANDACMTAMAIPTGPVHVNVPIREPFYPSSGDKFVGSDHVRIVTPYRPEASISNDSWNELLDGFQAAGRILIAGGQNLPDAELEKVLNAISKEWDIPVLTDCITNLESEDFIKHQDLFLDRAGDELRPDLLITFGQSFISKSFKQYIRTHKPQQHWQISMDEHLADPFQTITRQVFTSPHYFFTQLFEKLDYQLFTENAELDNDTGFLTKWRAKELASRASKAGYLQKVESLNDLTGLDEVFRSIHFDIQLHLANSMSVRYANALRPECATDGIYSNRGTSGIDGCVSTALGAAKVNGKPTLLVVGDVAFLYDRNALLSQDLPANLKIVVLNNGGGNIFRMIDGPSALPELEKYFETQHPLSARRTCEDADIAYYGIRDMIELRKTLPEFITSKKTSLMEIFTEASENKLVWRGLKNAAANA